MARVGPWIGYILGLAAGAVLVWAAIGLGPPLQLNLLILVTGGLTGWLVGILMTPASGAEQSRFPEYGKAISAAGIGYLAAKLDKVFDLSIKGAGDINVLFVGRVLLFVGSFVLGALLTYVWRAYVAPTSRARG